MSAHWLQGLTAYMTTLDQDDALLGRVGMYRSMSQSLFHLAKRGFITKETALSKAPNPDELADLFVRNYKPPTRR